MNSLAIFYRASVRAILFAFVVIVLFNMLTEVAMKTGIIADTLTVAQMQYFGALSLLFAMLDVVSNRFFGLTFTHRT